MTNPAARRAAFDISDRKLCPAAIESFHRYTNIQAMKARDSAHTTLIVGTPPIRYRAMGERSNISFRVYGKMIPANIVVPQQSRIPRISESVPNDVYAITHMKKMLAATVTAIATTGVWNRGCT